MHAFINVDKSDCDGEGNPILIDLHDIWIWNDLNDAKDACNDDQVTIQIKIQIVEAVPI